MKNEHIFQKTIHGRLVTIGIYFEQINDNDTEIICSLAIQHPEYDRASFDIGKKIVRNRIKSKKPTDRKWGAIGRFKTALANYFNYNVVYTISTNIFTDFEKNPSKYIESLKKEEQ